MDDPTDPEPEKDPMTMTKTKADKKAKPTKKGAGTKKAAPKPDPEKTPAFNRHGFVKEYHETELTNDLSGCRVVVVSTCSLAEMPLGDAKNTTDRVRYGKLVVTFPVVIDGKSDVERLTIPGRLTLKKTHPTKKAEAGTITLDMKASEVLASETVDRLIGLKRDDVQVEVSFFGTFEQKTMEGLVDKQDLG